jgi:hypothetical protein
MAYDREAMDLSELEPPQLCSTGGQVTGAGTTQHRIENECRRKAQLADQTPKAQWTIYKGESDLPQPLAPLLEHCEEMCPSSLALHHLAANLLKEWAKYGCLTCTEWPWTKEQMQEAMVSNAL